MKRSISIFILSFLIQLQSFAQSKGFPYDSIDLNDFNAFVTGKNWRIAKDVFYDLRPEGKTIITSGKGIAVNEVSDKNKEHLVTKMEHGDIDLQLDFMMDKNSNAGVYLQGRYEIQMFDSWGIKNPKSTDCGAVYERWDESKPEGRKGYEGHPPSQNVSKAPGLWQHYRIVFRAPRFNAKGVKTENAKFIRVEQNGVVIHENVEVTGPTRAAIFQDEKALGPIVVQGDHGPVAIRNMKYKLYGDETVSLTNLKLSAYEGSFKSIQDFQSGTPVAEMKIDLLEHRGTESKDHFAGIIKGKIHLPKSAKYFLQLDLKWIPADTDPTNPNGGGVAKIGDKIVLSIDGRHGGITSATTTLDSGIYPIEISYFKTWKMWYAQSDDIILSVETPGMTLRNLNAMPESSEAVGAITVVVTDQPVMQRSFIKHGGKKKTHVISVGEPGGVNYSIELSSGSLLQFWRGKFIETTLMWYGRGEPQLAEPLGSIVELPGKTSIAFLTDKNAAWPDSTLDFNYIGYDLNKSGQPIFKYSIGGVQVKDRLESSDDGKKLSHTLVLSNLTKDAWCRVAEGSDIIKQPSGLYSVNDKQYFIQLKNKSEPIIRKTTTNKMELLLPIRKQSSGEVQYSIMW